MKTVINNSSRKLRDGDFIMLEYSTRIIPGVYHIINGIDYLAYFKSGRFILEEIDEASVKRIGLCENVDTTTELQQKIESRYAQVSGRKQSVDDKIKAFIKRGK